MENKNSSMDEMVQNVISFIDEQLKTKFPDEIQTISQKAFFMAKTKRAIMDKEFFYLINQNENPKEFHKIPYSDQADIDINSVDEEGNTLLHYLATNCHYVPFSEYLIKKGACVNLLNKNQEPALKFNAHQLNGYILPVIEQTDKKYLNKVYFDGETILTKFFQKGSTCHIFDVAYALIKAGADINFPNQEGKNPLYYLNERIKKYEKDTKGYENLKYAINELSQMGAKVSSQTKVCTSQKTSYLNKPSCDLERDF